VTGAPAAQQVSPLPFELVSRSGRQAASDLHASFCPRHPGISSCAMMGHLVPPTGPIPASISVVRPGERVRIVVPPHVALVAGVVSRLCSGPAGFGADSTDFEGTRWTVPLKPGRYLVDVAFGRSDKKGHTTASGLVGLLVSSSTPLGILHRPRCS
jgi:hypothetical protein